VGNFRNIREPGFTHLLAAQASSRVTTRYGSSVWKSRGRVVERQMSVFSYAGKKHIQRALIAWLANTAGQLRQITVTVKQVISLIATL